MNLREISGKKRLLAHAALAIAAVGLLCGVALCVFDKIVMPHFVGKGQAEVAVPSIVGKSPEDARSILLAAGLVPVLDPSLKHSETIEQGLIALQSPAAGGHVKPGRAVRFWTSSGRNSIAVPDVQGQDSTKAARTIEEAGLALGAADHKLDSLAAAGTVLRTIPAAGTNLGPGAKVSLVLSLGKDTASAPVDTHQVRGLF